MCKVRLSLSANGSVTSQKVFDLDDYRITHFLMSCTKDKTRAILAKLDIYDGIPLDFLAVIQGNYKKVHIERI